MRIAVVNWSRRRVGGAETYLGGVIPELLRLGHEIGFFHEVDTPQDREPISLPEGLQTWSVAELGEKRALAALRKWQPDLVYVHGLLDPKLEASVLSVAPSVFFAHSFYGTCISGSKTFKHPVVKPCERRFGWQCLTHYYPHHCGGLSPITMVRDYRRQSMRLDLLARYNGILAYSNYIRTELMKHGLAAKNAFTVPDFVPDHDGELQPLARENGFGHAAEKPVWNLLFSGRMDLLKGGEILLRALPAVRRNFDKPLKVTFAGDGPERRKWESIAGRLQRQTQGIEVEFSGWMSTEKIEALLKECDLLVLPSLWPEPFGLAGLDAGLRGVPVAAFAVGGISDWLVDGVNGCTAPGDPPTAAGLAQAIVRALRDPTAHAHMKCAALRLAERFKMENHLEVLVDLFESVTTPVEGPRDRENHSVALM